jgi:hypothetical protein
MNQQTVTRERIQDRGCRRVLFFHTRVGRRQPRPGGGSFFNSRLVNFPICHLKYCAASSPSSNRDIRLATARVRDRYGRSYPSTLSEVIPPTGKPDAGNPPVRFGGRGDMAIGLPCPDHDDARTVPASC